MIVDLAQSRLTRHVLVLFRALLLPLFLLLHSKPVVSVATLVHFAVTICVLVLCRSCFYPCSCSSIPKPGCLTETPKHPEMATLIVLGNFCSPSWSGIELSGLALHQDFNSQKVIYQEVRPTKKACFPLLHLLPPISIQDIMMAPHHPSMIASVVVRLSPAADDGASSSKDAAVVDHHSLRLRRGRRICGRRRRRRRLRTTAATSTTTTPYDAPSDGRRLEAPLVAGSAASAEAFGERLYPLVHATQPMLAGKITGMFLYEMDDIELAYLIDNPGAIDDMIREALDVLGGGGVRRWRSRRRWRSGSRGIPRTRVAYLIYGQEEDG